MADLRQISSSGVVLADDIPGIVEFIQMYLTMDLANRPSSPDNYFGTSGRYLDLRVDMNSGNLKRGC